MRLSDDELRDVLARAEEIERGAGGGGAWSSEVSAVVAAAEGIGLSRRAVELALNERFPAAAQPPQPGALVWARSTDGQFYVAEVLQVADDNLRVRFLRGGDHLITLDQVRPAGFLPGERVVVDWPMWGPWTCTVVAYDARQQVLTLNDGWGYTRTFPLSDVWHVPPRRSSSLSSPTRSAWLYASVAGAATLGALIGSVITLVFLR